MALPNIDYGENCSLTIALNLLSGDGEGGKKSAVLLLELIMVKLWGSHNYNKKKLLEYSCFPMLCHFL